MLVWNGNAMIDIMTALSVWIEPPYCEVLSNPIGITLSEFLIVREC